MQTDPPPLLVDLLEQPRVKIPVCLDLDSASATTFTTPGMDVYVLCS